jgi:PAS domain S-box-containing protein
MATSAPVRVLIADESLNRAHEIDSILRNAGIHTRPEFVEDLAATNASINTHHPDLVVCNADFDVLGELLPQLREGRPDLPIIIVDPTAQPANLTRGLAIGATDVVWPSDEERLLHVVKREIAHVCERHRWKDTRRALKEAERRCELLLANSTAAIAYVHEGMHIYANDDYFKLFGFTDADDMLGIPLLDLMDPDFAEQFKAKMKAFRSAEDETRFSFRGRRVTGEPIEGEMTLSGAEYEGEHCTQVLVRKRPDVVQSATANGSAAPRDNTLRSGIDELFTAAERLFAAEDGEGAIFVIEVDDFDTVLDEHGLLVGERIMSALGEAIRAEASDEAGDVFLCRVGTQRFALAIPGATPASCDVLAEHMRKYVEELLLDVDGRAVRCTITLGADVAPAVGALRAALEGAFRAMIAARKPAPAPVAPARAETNGAAVAPQAEAALPEEAVLDDVEAERALTPDQQRILDLVNKAIENGKFVLLFQPIISLRGDSDEHYEVFLRLTDEKGDRLPPDQFLKLAIDHGVAGKIDRWVILQSIKLLSMHRSKGHNTRLTINLTFNSLVDPDFVQWLGVAIKAARLPSDAVIFQVAEQDTAAYPREAREFIAGLRAMHCRSSLRHFGTVPEPFENLQQLPVDFVKLDGGHIQKVNERPETREVLTKMIRELQSHGKLTIVPMVESATVLSALWQAGANYIQGHYLQEPSTEMNYDFSSDD